MDNTIDTNGQNPNIQADISSDDNVNSEEINIESQIDESSQSGDADAEITDNYSSEELPAQIKVGDKEYTTEQLQGYISKINEQEKDEYQPRDLNIITGDYEKVKNDGLNDFNSLLKKFAVKATPPVIEVRNSQTGEMEEVYNTDAIANACESGCETGNFDEFIKFLNPIDVKNFLSEKNQLIADYNKKINYLENDYAESNKRIDSKNWGDYIKKNCKNDPKLAHFLNGFSKRASFNEDEIKDFIKLYKEASALSVNKDLMQQQTDEMKAEMMNTNVNPQNTNQKARIFSDKEIGEMSMKEYAKNAKEIDRQVEKGLIKRVNQ